MLRGDRCHVEGLGDGTLIGWDTDWRGIYGESRYVSVKFDDGRVIIINRRDSVPSNTAST
jgi:hypothetical protein